MEFRALTLNDKPDLLELDRLTFPGDELNPDTYESSIQNPGFIGLFVDDQLVGYLSLRDADSYGHLGRIAVHPEHHRKGYGNKLMEHAMQWFSDHGSKTVGIYVETSNDAAIPLYKKFGFDVAHESWHYIIDLTGNSAEKLDNYKLTQLDTSREDLENVVDEIIAKFPHLRKDLILDFMIPPSSNQFFVLKNEQGEIEAFMRFNPSFSGCMPFEVTSMEVVDQVILRLAEQHVQDDKDYLRLTFDNYSWLAEEFDRRGYKQHHHLYKMEQEMD